MENIVGDLKLNKYEDYINVFDALSISTDKDNRYIGRGTTICE